MFKTLAACALLLGLATTAHAQDGGLTVELNKLEAGETGSCRAFFLFRNETGMSFQGFEMSLAILDTGGVIGQLLSINAAPLPVARTTLKLFEIPETTCDGIGEILLHEMTACQPQNAEEMDCFEILTLDSKATVPLVK